MYTATARTMLPTTVTGSWPRPRWYRAQPGTGPISMRLLDNEFREQFLDANAVVVGEQDRAGLDILTNGDAHLDDDLGGFSWMNFALSRLSGVDAGHRLPSSAFAQPPGTLLGEVLGGWRYPPVVA